MTIHFDKLDLDNDLTPNSRRFDVASAPVRRGFYQNGMKRAFDMLLILIAAPFVVPLVAILALLVVARDGSSPFYWSARVGRNGRIFRMLKLRTMVPNADEMLEAHLQTDAEARAEWDATQKLKNDPRITAFGRALRKSSFDELPQLWNVLIGDMSIVGPRPMLPEQRAIYPGLAYYNLRPGITGPWQVADRNQSDFSKRADYDREYNEKLSFFMDIRLIMKTVGVVFRGTGY